MVFQYHVKGLTAVNQTVALDTTIKVKAIHLRLPAAVGCYSHAKVCMFLSPASYNVFCQPVNCVQMLG
jgi:hypothetical protein